MFNKSIQFQITENNRCAIAVYKGKTIASIFFINIGIDKLMISETDINSNFQKSDLQLELLRYLVNIARLQHRKIISISPNIIELFKNHPEFDDVRMLNNTK